jgi:hypothetical protein
MYYPGVNLLGWTANHLAEEVSLSLFLIKKTQKKQKTRVTRTSNRLSISIILNVNTGLASCGFSTAARMIFRAARYFSLAASRSDWSWVTFDMAASPTAVTAS